MLDAKEMLRYLPEIPEDICLSSVQICNIDSTNMTYREWLKIAAAIEENYCKYDGFVICHGTDTMADPEGLSGILHRNCFIGKLRMISCGADIAVIYPV